MIAKRRASAAEEAQVVQRLMARERLSIDDTGPGRTCFLSHLGAQTRLLPSPWIAHRDLVVAMARANLTGPQRTSLARAVLVEHGREFGVGRLRLEAVASGLPLGGSSLWFQPRAGGLSCLYTWALGTEPAPAKCDWLRLAAEPEWAVDEPPRSLAAKGLATLAAIGGQIVVLVGNALAAVQIAQLCRGKVAVGAHPRFAPHLETHQPDAQVLLWPHDALDAAGLRRREVAAIVLVGCSERIKIEVEGWRDRIDPRGRIDVQSVACPGRANRKTIESFWEACGNPRVLLTGDAAAATGGARWLRSIGAEVEVHGQATQLELL